MTRLLKGLFASMSLERKCLLFFGSALMVLMLGAFAVVEKLGRELVLNTTRQRAKDFAAIQLLLLHDDAVWSQNQQETVASGSDLNTEKVDPKIVLSDLRKVIIGAVLPATTLTKKRVIKYQKANTNFFHSVTPDNTPNCRTEKLLTTQSKPPFSNNSEETP